MSRNARTFIACGCVAGLFAVAASALGACDASSSTGTPLSTDAAAEAADDAAEASVNAGDAADGGGAGDAACALPGSFGSTKCNGCVATSCCGAVDPCMADPTCKALAECFLACFDEPDAGGCTRTCKQNIPDDAGLFEAVNTCAFFKSPCAFHCSSL